MMVRGVSEQRSRTLLRNAANRDDYGAPALSPSRVCLLIALALMLTGCTRSAAPVAPAPNPILDRIDHSLDRAAHYLLSQRNTDGTWTSDTDAAFRDPAALTPLVADTLQGMPATPQTQAAIDNAADHLAALVQPNGRIDSVLSYPAYTAPLAAVVLGRLNRPQHQKAREAWLAFLRQRQLTEPLGWAPEDKEYGGWGYCAVEPEKPQPGKLAPARIESNLSATLFSLVALRAAGCPADDPAIRKALVFVRRCQNFHDDPAKADPRFDDGGFYFIYDDPVRNKPGIAGKDASGRQRFHSYGSMTADGLRALRLCGLPETDGRVSAARTWLERHFSAATHPGTYDPVRAGRRNAVYYYYSASASQALSESKLSWAEPLADELMKRQGEDGSWENPIEDVRENDPILCTCLAVRALVAIRHTLEPGRTAAGLPCTASQSRLYILPGAPFPEAGNAPRFSPLAIRVPRTADPGDHRLVCADHR